MATLSQKERAYLSRANGRWEAYVYTEDGLETASAHDRDALIGYLEKHGYEVIDIDGE